MRPPEELETLKLICPNVKEMSEGDTTFYFLPDLKISGQGNFDALLCPQGRDGYPTRLFLSKKISGKGDNWKIHRIFDREWHTWSWKDVGVTLSLTEILSAHLDALR
jgi:hypothetical protein